MDNEKRAKIYKYLEDQIKNINFRIEAYVLDEDKRENPTRNCYIRLESYLRNFLDKKSDVRWLIMSGLRGAGKTTLLSQLYYKTQNIKKIYLSVDHIVQILNVSLQDVLEVYQEILGISFEQSNDQLILFLDEVQYEKNWSIILKSLYDRTKNVFVIATGSSAVELQSNPDITRRAVFEKVFPMSFTEYEKIKQRKYEEKGLSRIIRKSLFDSDDAEGVYHGLREIEPLVRKYWNGIKREDIDEYVHYGSLPFMLKVKNEAIVYEQVKKTLDRIITTDIPALNSFDQEVITKIPELLYMIADSDILSITKLSKLLEISKPTVSDILDVLEKTETLIRIYPYGNSYFQVRKASKYLFSSPAFRSMYFNFIGSTSNESNIKGKLLEDTVGMYLHRYLSSKINTFLTYDPSENAADFVIGYGKRRISMEVGHNKDYSQLYKTITKTQSAYGLVVSFNDLSINDSRNAVIVPITYFLLM